MKRPIKKEFILQVLRDGRKIDHQYFEYDKSGNVLIEVLFSERGEQLVFKEYSYEKGLLKTEFTENENGNKVVTRYEYNSYHELIRTINEYEDGTHDKEERTIFDDKEISIEYDSSGGIVSKMVLYKDEDGLPTKYEHYAGEELASYNELINDKEGRLIKRVTHYCYEDHTKDTLEIIYDRNGKEKELTFYGNSNELEWVEKNEYNRDLIIRRTTSYPQDPQRDQIVICEYDFKNNLIAETHKTLRGDIVFYNEMAYNSYGDVIAWRTIDKLDFDGITNEYVKKIEYY